MPGGDYVGNGDGAGLPAPPPGCASAWTSHSAPPSPDGGGGREARSRGTAEKGGDRGGGGRNAWVGTPGPHWPPHSPLVHRSAATWPPGLFLFPWGTVLLAATGPLHVHVLKLFPSVHVTSHLYPQLQCHFPERLTLTTGWSMRVPPVTADLTVP